MKRFVVASIFAASGVLAFALGSFSPVFYTTYKVAPGSPLAEARCSVCHVGPKGGALNPYGLDLQKVMKGAHARKVTPELLHQIDNVDSLKTGSKNIDRIKAGKNPGIK